MAPGFELIWCPSPSRLPLHSSPWPSAAAWEAFFRSFQHTELLALLGGLALADPSDLHESLAPALCSVHSSSSFPPVLSKSSLASQSAWPFFTSLFDALFLSLYYFWWSDSMCCFFSAAKSCLALCGPMDCITQSFPSPVLYCLSRSLIIFFSIESVMHPTNSFSAALFSSWLQSFPASGSFPMSRLFASGGQSIGVSASASVLPMRPISFRTDWFDLFVFQGTVKSKPFSFIYLFTLWLPHWMNFHGAGTWLPCLEECLSHGQWSLAICWVCEWC